VARALSPHASWECGRQLSHPTATVFGQLTISRLLKMVSQVPEAFGANKRPLLAETTVRKNPRRSMPALSEHAFHFIALVEFMALVEEVRETPLSVSIGNGSAKRKFISLAIVVASGAG